MTDLAHAPASRQIERASRAWLDSGASGFEVPAVLGAFELLDKIGEGAFGFVFKARHREISKQVAIKVLRPGLAKNLDIVKRFHKEADAIARIRSEHIVEVSHFGWSPCPYFVMELLDGRSLRDLLHAEGPLPEARVLRIFAGLARAIEAAHAQGCVHRDLKPENIFLVSRNEDPDFVKVLDFGIAKLNQPGLHHTATGAVLGTPQYMSPEQSRGSDVDSRTDIYALGVILYEMVTGRPPFRGEGFGDVAAQHARDEPPPPSRLVARISPFLEAAILKALAKDAGDRHPTVAHFREALEPATRRREAPRSPGPAQGWRQGVSLRVVLGVAALAAVTLGGSLVAPRTLRPPSGESDGVRGSSSAPANPAPVHAEPGTAATPPGTPGPADAESTARPAPAAASSAGEAKARSTTPRGAPPPPARPALAARLRRPPRPDVPELAPAPTRSIEVTVSSRPPGVEVHVNGQLACRPTPCRVRFVGDGPFRVRLEGPEALEPKELVFGDVEEVRTNADRLRDVFLDLR